MRRFLVRHKFKALGAASILIAAAGGAAFVAGAAESAPETAAADAPQGPPPAPVRVARAVETTLSPLAEAPGTVVSVSDSLVAAATAGKIEWIADIGAEIAEGEEIARIDNRDALAMRDDARAEVGRLAARADYLASVVARYEGLGEESGEPEASLDQMRADRDEAVKNLDRAKVTLRRAETTLDRTIVRAPFTGRIAAREIEVGEYANPGAPIARLVDTRNLEIRAHAPAVMTASLKAGDVVDVANGLSSAKATVRAVAPASNEVSRTLELRLALADVEWPVGAAVRVNLPASAPKKAVAAHRDAVVLRADRISVFTVDAQNVAHRVDVELGAADGDFIEIIGDVKAGDPLVVRGGERLRDGQTVVIQASAGAVS